MVIVDQNVIVSAFNKEGNRDDIQLKAGTQVYITRPADSDHMLCWFGHPMMKIFAFVPSNHLRKVTAQGEASFSEFMEGFEVSPFEEEPKSFKEKVREEEEDEEETVSPPLMVGPVDLPEDIPQQAKDKIRMIKTFSGHKFDYLPGFGNRFIMTSAPVRRMKDKTKSVPKTRGVRPPGLPAPKKPMTYHVVDIQTLEDFPAEGEVEAQQKAQAIIEREQQPELPETKPYIGFVVKRTTDTEGKTSFSILESEGGSPLSEEAFETQGDAERYIDEHLEELLSKAEPQTT